MPIKSRRGNGALNGNRIVRKSTLITALSTAFGPRWDPNLRDKAYLLVGDMGYHKPSKAEVEDFVRRWRETRPAYVADRYDCDDYAWTLKAHLSDRAAQTAGLAAAYAVGVIWSNTAGSGHAYNWVYTAENEVWLIEPQSGEMWRPGQKPPRAGDPSYDRDISLVVG